MPASKPIPFEGVLNCWNDEHDLPDLLLAVSRAGKTGRLQFSNAESDKTLYVKDGRIVFAESSSDDDGLGQHLLRVGQLSLEDYLRVSRMVEPGKRLGALLVAEGVLEPKELVPAVVGQVRDVILGLFRRTETWYGFREEALSRKESITLDIPVARLILDGVQQVESWRRVSKGVGELDSVYRIADASREEWSKLELDEPVTELLSMLEEPVSVAHICTHAGLPDFDACRYLWAFRTLGWIEPPAMVREEAPAEEEPLDDDALVAAAAASADSAASAPEPAPVRPVIPERLIQTRVSVRPPEKPAPKPPAQPEQPEPASPPAPPAPRPVPEDLTRTQLAVEPPRPSPEVTSPDVSPRPAPKPIPNDLVHTRLDVKENETPRSEEKTLPTPSAAEMMESILEGGGASAPPPSAPEPGANAATQFFAGPSAFEEPEAAGPESSDPFSAVSYDGFDSMPFDESPAPALEPPPPSPPEPSGPSFEDLALSDPAMPIASAAPAAAPKPELAPVPEPEPALPVLEGDVVEPEPQQAEGGGMEFLMSNDPMAAVQQDPVPQTQFSTYDPLQFGEEPVSASLPKRPKTDEMDLDAEGLGHVFRPNR